MIISTTEGCASYDEMFKKYGDIITLFFIVNRNLYFGYNNLSTCDNKYKNKIIGEGYGISLYRKYCYIIKAPQMRNFY